MRLVGLAEASVTPSRRGALVDVAIERGDCGGAEILARDQEGVVARLPAEFAGGRLWTTRAVAPVFSCMVLDSHLAANGRATALCAPDDETCQIACVQAVPILGARPGRPHTTTSRQDVTNMLLTPHELIEARRTPSGERQDYH